MIRLLAGKIVKLCYIYNYVFKFREISYYPCQPKSAAARIAFATWSVFRGAGSPECLGRLSILYYVEHYRPFDKAGAYGIQEGIGSVGVRGINGSFFNVVGLPVQRLSEVLLKF